MRFAVLVVCLTCLASAGVSDEFVVHCRPATVAENLAAATTNPRPQAGQSTDTITTSIQVSAVQPEVGKTIPAPDAKVRKFTFRYRFRVHGLKPSGTPEKKDIVRVWTPCPPNSDCQQVDRLEANVPGKLVENNEPRFGNRILYFETAIPASGEFTADISYKVTRHEVLRNSPHPENKSTEKLESDKRALYLAADRMVPTTGKPLKMLDSVKLRTDKLDLARQLYDIVDDHVTYKKEGTGWGRGDTNWVCDSGFGNCTDFHSLFMSLARSQGLPARFEIGFSIPPNKADGPISGYHCWAWFFIDGSGWIPVDISEADKNPKLKDYYFGNLTADRVMFSAGRDLELVPRAATQPLNFFINPHIEVGEKVLSAENIELKHEFKSLE